MVLSRAASASAQQTDIFSQDHEVRVFDTDLRVVPADNDFEDGLFGQH